MNTPHTRTCQSCGALAGAGLPCPACSISGALAMLELDELPSVAGSFSPFELPSTFGHYRVEREIAAGGAVIVYEAEDIRLGRTEGFAALIEVSETIRGGLAPA